MQVWSNPGSFAPELPVGKIEKDHLANLLLIRYCSSGNSTQQCHKCITSVAISSSNGFFLCARRVRKNLITLRETIDREDHACLWPNLDPLRALAFSDVAHAIDGMLVAGKWVGEVGNFQSSILNSPLYQVPSANLLLPVNVVAAADCSLTLEGLGGWHLYLGILDHFRSALCASALKVPDTSGTRNLTECWQEHLAEANSRIRDLMKRAGYA